MEEYSKQYTILKNSDSYMEKLVRWKRISSMANPFCWVGSILEFVFNFYVDFIETPISNKIEDLIIRSHEDPVKILDHIKSSNVQFYITFPKKEDIKLESQNTIFKGDILKSYDCLSFWEKVYYAAGFGEYVTKKLEEFVSIIEKNNMNPASTIIYLDIDLLLKSHLRYDDILNEIYKYEDLNESTVVIDTTDVSDERLGELFEYLQY